MVKELKKHKEILEAKRNKVITRNRKLREQIITRNKKCDQWRTEISQNILKLNRLNEEIKAV